MLKITDLKNAIYIDRKKALRMEVKLNKSDFGEIWSYISIALYNYACIPESAEVIAVSAEQFEVLRELIK